MHIVNGRQEDKIQERLLFEEQNKINRIWKELLQPKNISESRN